MSELLITSSIDPIEEGAVFLKGLPRHVTIWQYFTLPDSRLDAFTTELGEAIEAFSPITIIGGEDDMFGPKNDTPVRRVRSLGRGAASLEGLHAVTGAIIERHDGEIQNPAWAYNGFQAHMTYVDGLALDKGEEAHLKTIELIEKKEPRNYKLVRKMWELEDA